MTFKDYLVVMALTTVAAWIAWIVVLVGIDPSSAGTLAYVFFYSTLAIALVGTLSTSGAAIRVWARREELVPRHVSRSLRQAVLVSALVLACYQRQGSEVHGVTERFGTPEYWKKYNSPEAVNAREELQIQKEEEEADQEKHWWEDNP